ncbi:FAD binding domain-containing protein [Desulfotomaculum sp. 1211_IL3151]|uniref:FAD binding domain-containing protein n=1 Tax=Desulfotomaculum sp. 1211_IL3151 TaxID=3084055 RepID=UPI002FD8DFB6
MIPFDFEYHKPTSLAEAIELFAQLTEQGKEPLYYGGGTETISFSRLYQLFPRAVIDIKGIPECNTLAYREGKLVIGAAATLSQIQASNMFPLLSWCGGRVADHTIRNKITLGGNICSRIPYREAILALLVSDCELIIWGQQGQRRVPIGQAYNQALLLEQGELLVQIVLDQEITKMPFVSMKKTADGLVNYPQDRIGYPVVSAAALKKDDQISFAFSGLCSFPFRSRELETLLNHPSLSLPERVKRAVQCLPSNILTDMSGSAAYREFVWQNMLTAMLQDLEG